MAEALGGKEACEPGAKISVGPWLRVTAGDR